MKNVKRGVGLLRWDSQNKDSQNKDSQNKDAQNKDAQNDNRFLRSILKVV